MKQIKRAGQSVRSGLSLMCIVCLLCGLLCGFFWLAGESPVLAAGVDGDALSARAVLSGDASLSAPERDEKLAVQAAAQATSPVVRTLAVGMDAADYTETVTCDYTPVYIDDSFGGYCYVIDGAAWLSADAFAEMLGLESATVTDGDTQTVTVDGADIAATYGAVSYTANGRCFYAPDGVYALDGKVVLPLADLEKIFGVTATFSADNTSLTLSVESDRADRGIAAQQFVYAVRLLVADVAVEASFPLALSADVPQRDARVEQHGFPQRVVFGQFPVAQPCHDRPECVARVTVILSFCERHRARHRAQHEHAAVLVGDRSETLQF